MITMKENEKGFEFEENQDPNIRNDTIRGKILEIMVRNGMLKSLPFINKMESYIIQEVQNACAAGYSIGRSALKDEEDRNEH